LRFWGTNSCLGLKRDLQTIWTFPLLVSLWPKASLKMSLKSFLEKKMSNSHMFHGRK
jgi:hypothetical protein